jgi:decaprenyl-phosphate phosphoribosyltransferase
MLKHIISLIRIKHWVKNVLIFLPAFFGRVIQNNYNIITLFYLFLYFSISASLVYILNLYSKKIITLDADNFAVNRFKL